MINTVLFDMGGTLEDIWYNDQTIQDVTRKLLTFLQEHDMVTGSNEICFWNKINNGIRRYKQWSEGNALELKPEEIWPQYYLSEFDLDKEKVARYAEDMAGLWEVTYYHRELRPGVKEALEELKNKGYRLGVISNTASLYSVFDVLEAYGIRDYFEDVTLSSVTGYRKPHPGIFQIALREMKAKAEDCAYVGDTAPPSRSAPSSPRRRTRAWTAYGSPIMWSKRSQTLCRISKSSTEELKAHILSLLI